MFSNFLKITFIYIVLFNLTVINSFAFNSTFEKVLTSNKFNISKLKTKLNITQFRVLCVILIVILLAIMSYLLPAFKFKIAFTESELTELNHLFSQINQRYSAVTDVPVQNLTKFKLTKNSNIRLFKQNIKLVNNIIRTLNQMAPLIKSKLSNFNSANSDEDFKLNLPVYIQSKNIELILSLSSRYLILTTNHSCK